MSIREEFRTFVDDIRTERGAPVYRDGRLVEETLELVSHGLGSTAAALRSGARHRYIVAPPRFASAASPAAQEGLNLVQRYVGSAVLRSEDELSAKVMLISDLEALVLKERFRGVLVVEVDQQHRIPRTPLSPLVEPISIPAGRGRPLNVRVRCGGAGVPQARVTLIPRTGSAAGYQGVTNAAGLVRVFVREADTAFARVIVEPRAGCWSRVLEDVVAAPTVELTLDPITPDGFDWGHREAGARVDPSALGRGVRVAIIDSGIARHASLNVQERSRNFILGEAIERWDDDIEGHGTHCAGVVAALARHGSTWGHAPGVELYALRVFGGEDGGGYASDIGAAIRYAVVELGCDVINLSLSSAQPSGFLRARLEEAMDAGVLCVAAAGNAGGPVEYPAKFGGRLDFPAAPDGARALPSPLPRLLAVAAMGKQGTYPKDSLHRDAETEAHEGSFVASFSNHGPEVALCAPGVAVTSTLPGDHFGAWDGTSMAAPHVTGIAAVTLASLGSEARGPERLERLVQRVLGSCRPLGFPREKQGAGLVQVAT